MTAPENLAVLRIDSNATAEIIWAARLQQMSYRLFDPAKARRPKCVKDRAGRAPASEPQAVYDGAVDARANVMATFPVDVARDGSADHCLRTARLTPISCCCGGLNIVIWSTMERLRLCFAGTVARRREGRLPCEDSCASTTAHRSGDDSAVAKSLLMDRERGTRDPSGTMYPNIRRQSQSHVQHGAEYLTRSLLTVVQPVQEYLPAGSVGVCRNVAISLLFITRT